MVKGTKLIEILDGTKYKSTFTIIDFWVLEDLMEYLWPFVS